MFCLNEKFTIVPQAMAEKQKQHRAIFFKLGLPTHGNSVVTRKYGASVFFTIEDLLDPIRL
jgi:hypothetical protein